MSRILLLCATLVLGMRSEVKRTIKIGLFIPGGIGGWADSTSLIPMGHVAQHQINNSTEVLGDYQFEMTWFNTQADAGKAIRELFSFIGTNETREYAGIVGPVFTDVTKYISELAPFFNYVSVSPTASSSSLSKVDATADYKYCNSVRLHPVETDIYKAIFQLAAECHWKKIHIVSSEAGEHEFRKSVINVFTDKIKGAGNVLYRYSFISSNRDTIRSAFDELQKNNARIIIANFAEDEAYDVFCIAKEKGFISESMEFTGKRVWILPSSYRRDWIEEALKKNKDLDCSKRDIIETVGTYLSPDFQWNSTETNLGTGYSFEETWEAYSDDFNANYKNSCGCQVEAKAGGLMYDSVWTLAKGLHNFLYRFDKISGTLKPSHSQNNDAGERDALLDELLQREGTRSEDLVKAMLNISFEGASGRIEFKNGMDSNCRSGFKVKIGQLQIHHSGKNLEGLGIKMAEVCESEDVLKCGKETKMWGTSIFQDISREMDCANTNDFHCVCPVDAPISDQMDKVIIGIPKTAMLFFTISSLLGILLSIGFFVFNIVFMNERVIKMSSPHLNNIILLGAVLLYSYVPLAGLMTGINGTSLRNADHLLKICSVHILTWVVCVGFTTSFGALFAKTWRVYAIFTSKKPRTMILSDWKLLVLVGIMLLVDVVILGADEYLNRFEWAFTPDNTKTELSTKNLLDDIPEIYGTVGCVYSNSSPRWLTSVAYVYKGLLLFFGSFIAFQTRNVSIPALNDSKFIGVSIYTIVVVSATAGPVSVSLRAQPELRFGIQAAGILFTTTVMICLVFLPKAYQLRYQPKQAVLNRKITGDWDSALQQSRQEAEFQNLLKTAQATVPSTLKPNSTF